MGLGKTYSADYLIDSNGNTGVSGQVLISTATGIDWADGTAITGGPFLPLSAGSSYPLTGDLYIDEDSLYLRNASNNYWRFQTATSDKLVIKAGTTQRGIWSSGELQLANNLVVDGNVGIGSTAPAAKLNVASTGANAYSSTITKGTNMKGIINALSNNADDMVGIYFGTGWTSEGTHWSGITGSRSQNASDWSTQLNFYTHDENVSNLNDATQKMVIKGSGNVGIGTATPVSKLHIKTSVDNSVAQGLVIERSANSDRGYINYNGGGFQFRSTVGDPIVFGETDAEHMRILPDGNVGIGTTNPGSLLQVGGLDDGSNYDITLGWNAVDSEAVGTKRSAITFKTGQTSVNTEDIYKWDIAMLAAPATVTNEEFGSDLAFLRSTRGSTATDATTMILTRTGNVGIGTTIPIAKLSVLATSTGYSSDSQIKVSDGSTSYYGGLSFDDAGSTRLSVRNSYDGTGAIVGFGFGGSSDKVQIINGTGFIVNEGNVGIGTTAPAQKLHVSGGHILLDNNKEIRQKDSGGTERTVFELDSSNDLNIGGSYAGALRFIGGGSYAEVMRIHDDGNVGIGTTSPGSKLEIHKSITYGSYGPAAPQLNLVNTHTEGTAGFLMLSARYNNTSPAQTFYQVGGMGGGKETALANNEWGGYINFFTTSDGTAGAASGMFEHMRITADGNVGIGTTSPTEKLVVNGNIETATPAGKIGFNVGDAHTNGPHYGLGKLSGANPVNLSGYYGLSFYTDGAERVRVSSAGNVGIGTTSPNTKLHVSGSIKAEGNGTDQYFFEGVRTGVGTTIRIYDNANTAYIDSYNNMAFRANQNGGSGGNFTFTGGNVGIGTTSPYGRLNVIPSSNPTTPTAANQISIGESSANSQYNLRLGYFLEGGAYKGSIQAISGNTPNTLILNGDGGNVGIGTTSPTHKLHVNGDMRLTGALRDSNNATGSAGQVLSSTGSATDWIPLPATPTIYTPKVYNLNNSTNINSQGQKLVPDFGTLEIEGNTTIQQVSGSDTDFQVTGENTGIYEVTYAVFYKNTGNQRTPLGTYLTLNGTAVNGSLMVNYLRSDVAGGGNWSSCTNTFYVNVTDASHPIALCVRRADSSTAPSGISMVEPAGMAVKSTISFRRIS